MKTLHKYTWMFLALFATMLTLTSCEEDEQIGMTVSGHWFGDMDMYVDNEKARGSEIEFTPTGWGSTSGRGYEIDYYRYGSITHDFRYQIRDGIIYMTFDDPNLDCAIVDYHLDSYYFRGYIADYYTLENQTYFNLRNYDRYWNEYGYGNYYYTKEQSMDSESLWDDAAGTRATGEEANATPKCIRGVNRIRD